jgi:hypothetical protein
MSVHNIVPISTNSGFKAIEIHHDDLSQLGWKVDVIVISAFSGNYSPIEGTLIHSLESNCDIVVRELFDSRLYDFRDSLNSWVSQKIENNAFSYLICLEGMHYNANNENLLEAQLQDLLAVISVLQQKGISVNTIALPFLGTGLQGVNVNVVMPLLIKKSKELLETIHSVQTVYFVHPNIEYIEFINNEINTLLHRTPDRLEKLRQNSDIAANLDVIYLKLNQLKSQYGWNAVNSIDELSRRIIQDDIRFYELGILTRRAMEAILKSVIKSDSFMTLSQMVKELQRFKLSTWMLSYMHTLRTFGNFLAHDSELENAEKQMTKDDVLFFIKALERFIEIISNHCNQL